MSQHEGSASNDISAIANGEKKASVGQAGSIRDG
jgi:hypothetical protein